MHVSRREQRSYGVKIERYVAVVRAPGALSYNDRPNGDLSEVAAT